MTKFYSRISTTLVGAVAIVVSVQILPATALERTEIGEIAKKFTVMIAGDCQGSGSIIERQGENYTVLTANHVVATTGECFIQTGDGMRYKIYEAINVPGTDLAVLQFQSKNNYGVAQTATSANLQPGSTVYVAGYPSPGQFDTKRGYRFYPANVNGRAPGSREGYELSYDGASLPGMSGGPVLDSNGRVVATHGKADVRLQQAVENYGVPFEIFLARRGQISRDARSTSAQNPPVQIAPPPPITPAPLPAPAPAPAPTPAAQPPEVQQPQALVPEPEPIVTREAQSPAESAISSMVRGQQTYVVRNRDFLNSVASIAKSFSILLPQDYNFAIRTTTRGAFHYAIPKSADKKAYVGAIFLEENASLSNPATVSIVCEATTAINVRPSDPTYGRNNLACGVGTERKTASSLPQQNVVTQLAPATRPAPTPAARANPPQTRASGPIGFLSLVNVCNTYDLTGQTLHQERALEWLQGRISAQTMEKFAQEWRTQLIARAGNKPINLVDVCKVYDRTGLHPHQNRALEWLQQQIPKETLTDFGKKWQNQAGS